MLDQKPDFQFFELLNEDVETSAASSEINLEQFNSAVFTANLTVMSARDSEAESEGSEVDSGDLAGTAVLQRRLKDGVTWVDIPNQTKTFDDYGVITWELASIDYPTYRVSITLDVWDANVQIEVIAKAERLEA